MAVSFEARQPLSEDQLNQLHAAIWRNLVDFMHAYTRTQACGKVWDFYLGELAYEERFRHVSERSVSFFFPDYAGCCHRSMDAAYHLFPRGVVGG